MITCCPNCGAVNSLDSLLSGEGSAELVQAALEFDAAIGKAAIPYIGLFRPAKSRLTHKRAAKLLNELLPDIKAWTIQRNGQTHAAPPEAWLYAFQTAIDARNAGRLNTPLKSHGYLYEIIAGWSGQGMSTTEVSSTSDKPLNHQTKPSQTQPNPNRSGIAARTQKMKELPTQLHNAVIDGLTMLLTLRLAGTPAADTAAATAQTWSRVLAHGREWDEARDVARFQTAFMVLANEMNRWPSPKDFLDNLPPPPEPLKLEHRYQPTAAEKARGQAALKKIQTAVNSILNGKTSTNPKGK